MSETLRERDARLNAWLAGVSLGDIVTVRLNETDTLTGKVYEAPDASGRTALYLYTTLLRYGNGYPGGSFEPLLAATAPTPDEAGQVEGQAMCCGHPAEMHGPEVPGCCECTCRVVTPRTEATR